MCFDGLLSTLIVGIVAIGYIAYNDKDRRDAHELAGYYRDKYHEAREMLFKK